MLGWTRHDAGQDVICKQGAGQRVHKLGVFWQKSILENLRLVEGKLAWAPHEVWGLAWGHIEFQVRASWAVSHWASFRHTID